MLIKKTEVPVRLSAMILFLILCLPAHAWTPKTRSYMAMKAFAAFPADLQTALNRHRQTFLNNAAATDLPESADEIVNESCTLLDEIQQELNGRPRFASIAARMGRLMGLIAEMGDPFQEDRGATATDYRAYAERKLNRFYFAFQPLSFEEIRDQDPCTHLFANRNMGQGYRSAIEADYERFGNSVRFDDRSVAFGCASLLFSDICLEMSRTAILVWHRSSGAARDARILVD